MVQQVQHGRGTSVVDLIGDTPLPACSASSGSAHELSATSRANGRTQVDRMIAEGLAVCAITLRTTLLDTTLENTGLDYVMI